MVTNMVRKTIEADFAHVIKNHTGAKIEFTYIGSDRFSILTDTCGDLAHARKLLDQAFRFIEQEDYPEDSMFAAFYEISRKDE